VRMKEKKICIAKSQHVRDWFWFKFWLWFFIGVSSSPRWNCVYI